MQSFHYVLLQQNNVFCLEEKQMFILFGRKTIENGDNNE